MAFLLLNLFLHLFNLFLYIHFLFFLNYFDDNIIKSAGTFSLFTSIKSPAIKF